MTASGWTRGDHKPDPSGLYRTWVRGAVEIWQGRPGRDPRAEHSYEVRYTLADGAHRERFSMLREAKRFGETVLP